MRSSQATSNAFNACATALSESTSLNGSSPSWRNCRRRKRTCSRNRPQIENDIVRPPCLRWVCVNSIYAREAFFIYINSAQYLTRELRTIRRFVLCALAAASYSPIAPRSYRRIERRIVSATAPSVARPLSLPRRKYRSHELIDRRLRVFGSDIMPRRATSNVKSRTRRLRCQNRLGHTAL